MEKRKKIRLIALILSVVLSAALVVGVVAYYAETDKVNGILWGSATFTSDYLKEKTNGAYPTYTIYDGSVDVKITASGVAYTLKKNGTTMTNTANHTYKIDGNPGERITVEATSPTVNRTVGAVFDFVANTKTEYKITDYDNRVVVDLYTGTTPPSIIINYDGNLMPDNTVPEMATWMKGGKTGTISNLKEYAHYELVFFKDKVMNFVVVTNLTELTATDNTITLTPATPAT